MARTARAGCPERDNRSSPRPAPEWHPLALTGRARGRTNRISAGDRREDIAPMRFGWRGIGSDPTTDAAAVDVIAAFEAAEEARLPIVRCYLAGVEAWRRAHPDQRLEYAARQAVAVIHAAKIRLRVED